MVFHFAQAKQKWKKYRHQGRPTSLASLQQTPSCWINLLFAACLLALLKDEPAHRLHLSLIFLDTLFCFFWRFIYCDFWVLKSYKIQVNIKWVPHLVWKNIFIHKVLIINNSNYNSYFHVLVTQKSTCPKIPKQTSLMYMYLIHWNWNQNIRAWLQHVFDTWRMT